jgi:hypothetical protein
MYNIIKSIYYKIKFFFVIFIGCHIRALIKAREIRCVQNNTNKIGKNAIILLAVLRNEAIRIPYFLEYYRKLGIDHFLFVDNDSTDSFFELVENDPDISVWHTKSSYKKSRYGVDWVNCLLRKFGRNRWCLTVDPDEFLVYPNCETRGLRLLVEHLNYTEQDKLFCPLVDMYSNKKFTETQYKAGEDPKEVCPYFDVFGYFARKDQYFQNIKITGGPRMRMFFKNHPDEAPALNKTPLVYWRWFFVYYSSTHSLVPRRLNKVHQKNIDLTGCLLHFKFISLLEEKAKEEVDRNQHFAGSREYKQYIKGFDEHGKSLYYPLSVKMNGPNDLLEYGLMTIGDWF